MNRVMGPAAAMGIPLALSAALFLILALAEWRRLPVVGRVYLAAATAFALGALTHPGMSISELMDTTRDRLSYVVGAARIVAFSAVLVSVATFLRQQTVP